MRSPSLSIPARRSGGGRARDESIHTNVAARKRVHRRKREAVVVVDNVLTARSCDACLGLWTLEAHHTGDVALMLDGQEIAFLSHKQGGAMMSMDACPYIRAADITSALLAGLAVEVGAHVRAELEVALARWIPLYFEL